MNKNEIRGGLVERQPAQKILAGLGFAKRQKPNRNRSMHATHNHRICTVGDRDDKGVWGFTHLSDFFLGLTFELYQKPGKSQKINSHKNFSKNIHKKSSQSLQLKSLH